MALDLPEHILQQAELSAPELRLALAIQLYMDRRLDYHEARAVAELPRAAWNHELSRRDLSVVVFPAPEPQRQVG